MNRWNLPLTIAILMLASVANAGQPRSIGLTFSGDRAGFFLDPVMTRVYISQVVSGSLGAIAGFQPKDEVLEIERIRVSGMRARALMDYWNTVSGRKVIHFVVSRNGASLPIDLNTQPAAP